jgi:ferric-chelate reductase (NADPH)
MRAARVATVEHLSAHFRRLALEGDELKSVDWTPGDQIQIAVGAGLMARTYTPISWDRDKGRTHILAFIHGEAPACRWFNASHPGDSCEFLGPRKSLGLIDLNSPAVVFGDETCFGLAAALNGALPAGGIRHVFEVSDVSESQAVLDTIGIRATLIQRAAGDAHLVAAREMVVSLAGADAQLVLGGKASSIQQVRKALKAIDIGSARVRSKAYWAPGKTGLD